MSKKTVDVEDGRVRRRLREVAKRRTNLKGAELEGGRERTGEGGRDKGTVRQLFELLLLLPPRSRIDGTGCILTGDCESKRERVSAVELGRGRQKREKGKGKWKRRWWMGEKEGRSLLREERATETREVALPFLESPCCGKFDAFPFHPRTKLDEK